jgi:cytochrome c553
MTAPSPDKDAGTSRLQRLGVAFGVVFATLFIGAAVFVLSGTYNIAAGRDHLSVTTWLLEVVRDRSIAVRTTSIDTPDLDDPDLIELGARHYRAACTFCHGTPGTAKNPVVAQMLPAPPDLSLSSRRYTPEELYWIIENGLKYTGMPAWPVENRGDEVWATVAFIMDLNKNGSGTYRAAAAETSSAPAGGEQTAALAPLGTCITCHGDGSRPPVSDLVPSLNGQPRDYLARALHEYRQVLRPSGIMAVAAQDLSGDEINALADYYAALPPVQPPRSPVDGNAARGRELVLSGFPEGDVPACASCHAGRAASSSPRLEGLSATYLTGQLNLWKNSERVDTEHGAIMAPIARRLTPEQIRDVSTYYQDQRPGGESGQ